MNRKIKLLVTMTSSVLLTMTGTARAVEFTDPTGDDDGPGEYIYPTDQVYLPGSFDLTGLTVEAKGKNVEFEVEVASKLQDPWGMGVGFAVQMVFIFIDQDGVAGSGHTEGLPGLNVQFAPDNAWEKVIVLSPQPASRVDSEVRVKAPQLRDDILIPRRTTGRGKGISGRIKAEDLGGGDPDSWSYQVLVQSNEGFPRETDLLTRRVNEYEGQHRFGGGNDADCDPHVMDILAGSATGAADEADLQHQMLSYECDEEGNSVQMATLTMVKK